MSAPTPTPLIVGNWKMNGAMASLAELQELASLLTTGDAPRAMVVVCPPATMLAAASSQGSLSGILTGGQDCHPQASGAFTGDLSAGMLADAGAQYVIVGHSERRTGYGETDALVRAKAEAGIGAGLKPVICVGETEEQRDAGNAADIVSAQIADSVPEAASQHEVVVAYEPVWAIGTGRVPSYDEIEQMHGTIRANLCARFGEERGGSIRILYGGSVKPMNAREILNHDNVNGLLVGAASLLAHDFYTIISSV